MVTGDAQYIGTWLLNFEVNIPNTILEYVHKQVLSS